jgi:ketosteroid isomerase-like protein
MSLTTSHDIQAANRTFEQEVIGKRNFAALDRVYTVNARILPPGADMISGRENIKNFWRAAAESMNVSSAKLETVEFEALGNTGVEIGRATLTFHTPGSQPLQLKYVVVWKQEDGMWKWHTDIWNPNS